MAEWDLCSSLCELSGSVDRVDLADRTSRIRGLGAFVPWWDSCLTVRGQKTGIKPGDEASVEATYRRLSLVCGRVRPAAAGRFLRVNGPDVRPLCVKQWSWCTVGMESVVLKGAW